MLAVHAVVDACERPQTLMIKRGPFNTRKTLGNLLSVPEKAVFFSALGFVPDVAHADEGGTQMLVWILVICTSAHSRDPENTQQSRGMHCSMTTGADGCRHES